MDGCSALILLCIAAITQHPVAVVGNLPPTFVKDMNLEVIKEDTPIGTSIYRLEGTDPEGGPITYGLHGTDYLVADATTGIVTLAKPLDHEITHTLKFHVTIEDNVGHGQENNKVSIPISLVILDVNDNSPAFQDEPYNVNVPEDFPIGAVVLETINMTDIDMVGGNLSVECNTLSMFPASCDMFSIQTKQATNMKYSGSLMLRKEFDYDENKFYQVLLFGTDGKYNTTSVVTVQVLDIPNKPPVIKGPLYGSLNESLPTGTTVMMIQAEDGDQKNQRNITYDLISNPGGYFDINYLTGEMHTVNQIDRESLTSGIIILKVRARENVNGAPLDDESSSSTAEVYLTVHDINDEPPKFSKETVEVQLLENQPNGTPLPNLNLFVSDPDTNQKAEMKITLLDSSGFFQLDTNTINGSGSLNILTKNGPLDYENPNHRKFILLATATESSTSERLSSTATVIVSVNDVNDNVPQFDRESYDASVMESAPPGTFIIKIIAVDQDSQEYGSSSIRYSLFGDGSDFFYVDAMTGVISVGNHSALDYETQFSYYLSYQAQDAAGMGFITLAPLQINLLDADDNIPTFSHAQYFGQINEGDTEFTPHLIVQAHDKDESYILRYEIIDGNENNTFMIDSSSGELQASNPSGINLDSLATNRFNLSIRVTDSGQNSAITTVMVTVQDINNNAPIFSDKLYYGNISEGAMPGSFVSKVLAIDSDSEENGLVTYQILNGARDNFVIDEHTGIVSTAADAKLDYDVRPKYSIKVAAVDKGTPPRTATATLMVSLEDSNNKPPVFTPKIQQTQVFENAKVGDVIYTLNATDPDATSVEFLKFQELSIIKLIDETGKDVITDMESSPFEVDKDSGDVIVVRQIRRERQAEITMTVALVDTSADPPQTGTGTLIVSVININNNAPVFPAPWSSSNPVTFINVLEEQPVGSIVYTFVALDADSNIAGYAIIPDDLYFDIDIISGVVTTKSRIDYEITQKHEFVVVAFDTGVPQLSATALVTATINNINDNDPQFNQTEYTTSILENSAVGTYITTVLAQDKDLGDFGRVIYSLIGDHIDIFSIDQKGIIHVKNNSALDREINPTFAVHVVAVDTAPIEMSRRSLPTPVYISLKDVNDNVPKFPQKEYHISVMDKILVFPPTPIIQFSASDNDEGLNALVAYKITEGNSDATFILNPRTGILCPAVSLVGKSKHHVLKVEARDTNGTSENYDEASVIIQVQEVNANAPRIMTPSPKNSTIHIRENEIPENNTLWTIFAEDMDTGENGHIQYFIKEEDRNLVETQFFSINPQTGKLRLNEPLDREAKSKYTLVVAARDDGVPQPFETLQQLLVIVDDVNDNDPQFLRTMFTSPYKFKVDENLPVGSFVGQVEAVDFDDHENAAKYYFLQDGSDQEIFAVDKLTGSIYTNRSLDFEKRQNYEITLKVSNNASFIPSKRKIRSTAEKMNYADNDTSLAYVRVHVGDINDNVPIFPESSYVVGISSSAKIDETVGNITAYDPDQDDNGTLAYTIEKTTWFSLGTRNSVRVLENTPFAIHKNGLVTTSEAMSLYSEDHFKLIIQCKESSQPGRSATTTLEVWVYENSQLVKVVITRPVNTVNQLLPTILRNLSNVTNGIAVVTDVMPYISNDANKKSDRTQLLILVIDPEKRVVKPVPDVLNSISRNADYVNVMPDMYKIVEVTPLLSTEKSPGFNLVLATFIALCVVLFIGIILIIIVFHCLKQWYKDKRIAIVKKREIPEPPITTENPLWIDTDTPMWVDPISKPYEEQELSMQVATDQEMQNRLKENGHTQPEAMYATVRRNGRSVRENVSAMEASDGYATVNQENERNTLRLHDHNGTLKSNRSGYHEIKTNGTGYGTLGRPTPSPVPPTLPVPVVTVRPQQNMSEHERLSFEGTQVL